MKRFVFLAVLALSIPVFAQPAAPTAPTAPVAPVAPAAPAALTTAPVVATPAPVVATNPSTALGQPPPAYIEAAAKKSAVLPGFVSQPMQAQVDPTTGKTTITPLPSVPPSQNPTPEDFARLVFIAIHNRNWLFLASLMLMGIVWVARQYGKKWWPFLGTDRGGALLALVGGIVSALVAALSCGASLSIQVLLDGVLAGVTAAGSYAVLRKLLFPSGADKAQEIVANVNADAAKKKEEAEKAGAQGAADAINRTGNTPPPVVG